MAKQIIVLETNPADGGFNNLKVVFWFAIPSNRRVPIPSKVSVWEGASIAETTALQDGSVLEEIHNIKVPASYTGTEQKAVLNKAFTDRAAYLAAQPFKLQFAGVFFDSVTGWSA